MLSIIFNSFLSSGSKVLKVAFTSVVSFAMIWFTADVSHKLYSHVYECMLDITLYSHISLKETTLLKLKSFSDTNSYSFCCLFIFTEFYHLSLGLNAGPL